MTEPPKQTMPQGGNRMYFLPSPEGEGTVELMPAGCNMGNFLTGSTVLWRAALSAVPVAGS